MANMPGASALLVNDDPFAPARRNLATFSTDISAVMNEQDGYNGGECALAKQREKLGIAPDFPEPPLSDWKKELYEGGHLMEEIAAKKVSDKTGISLLRRNNPVVSREHPNAASHPDRVACAVDERGPGDVEIKARNQWVWLQVKRKGVSRQHLLQTMWHMACSGHQWAMFVVICISSGLPIHYFFLDRDEALIDILFAENEKFWNAIRRGDWLPQLPDPNDLRCKLCKFRLQCRGEDIDPEAFRQMQRDRDRGKSLVQIENGDLDEALTDREKVLAQRQITDEALELVNERISELLGDHDAVEINRKWRIYHSAGKWTGLDQKRLKEEQPEIHKQFTVSKPTSKQLRVYAIGSGRE